MLAGFASRVFAVAVVLCFAGNLFAVTRTFDGGPTGTGTDWSVAANWSGDTLPGAADEALFNGTATAVSIVNVSGTIQRIVLNRPAGAQSLTFTLNGNLTLTGAAGTSIFVDTGESAFFQTSGGARILQCNDDIQAQGAATSLTFNANITILFQAGTPEFVINNGASLSMSGTLDVRIASQLNVDNTGGSTVVTLGNLALAALLQPDDVGGTPLISIFGAINITDDGGGIDPALIALMNVTLGGTVIDRNAFSNCRLQFGNAAVTIQNDVVLQNSGVGGGSWSGNPNFGTCTIPATRSLTINTGLGPVDFTGGLNISGTLQLNSNAPTIGGNFTVNSGGQFLQGTVPAAVSFVGSGNITGTITFGAQVAVTGGLRLVNTGSTVTINGSLLCTSGAFGALQDGVTASGFATINYNGNVRIDQANGWRLGEGRHYFAGNIDLGNTSATAGVTMAPLASNNEPALVNLVGGAMQISFASTGGSAFLVTSVAAATRVTQLGVMRLIGGLNLLGASGTGTFYAWDALGMYILMDGPAGGGFPTIRIGNGGLAVFELRFTQQASGAAKTQAAVTRPAGLTGNLLADNIIVEGDTIDHQPGVPDVNAASVILDNLNIIASGIEVREGTTAVVDGDGGFCGLQNCTLTSATVVNIGDASANAAGAAAGGFFIITGGSFSLSGGATLRVWPFARIQTQQGATITGGSGLAYNFQADAGSTVTMVDTTVTAASAASAAVSLGGTVSLTAVAFSNLNAAGLQFAAGATVSLFRLCTFQNGVAGGAHITLNGLTNGSYLAADHNHFDNSVGVLGGGAGGLLVDVNGGTNRLAFRVGVSQNFGIGAYTLSAAAAEADADNDGTAGTEVIWDDNPITLFMAQGVSPANVVRDTTPRQTVMLFDLSAVNGDFPVVSMSLNMTTVSGTVLPDDCATLTLFEDANFNGHYDTGEEWSNGGSSTLDLPFASGSLSFSVSTYATAAQYTILNGMSNRRLGWAVTFDAVFATRTGTLRANVSRFGISGATGVIVGLPQQNDLDLVDAATQLVITTQPSNAASGVNISPAMYVEVRNAAGQRVEGGPLVTVTVTISGPGTLGGSLTSPAFNGEAYFPMVNVTTGSTITTQLVFSATGLTSATSNSFQVTVSGGGGGGGGDDDSGCTANEAASLWLLLAVLAGLWRLGRRRSA